MRLSDLQQEKIKNMQKNITAEFGLSVLNMLNGQAMYDILAAHQLIQGSTYVPFNEAMCTPPTSTSIFSENFIDMRSKAHQVTVEDYKGRTIDPLTPFLENEYDCIVLWFGQDMFCQINLLTLLGYLDQRKYKGKIILHLVNEETYDMVAINIPKVNYAEIYEQVLIGENLPKVNLIPVLSEGIRLYLEYQKSDNEISRYIKQHLDQPVDSLLEQLFMEFQHFGLGDVQYYKMIESVKHSQIGQK